MPYYTRHSPHCLMATGNLWEAECSLCHPIFPPWLHLSATAEFSSQLHCHQKKYLPPGVQASLHTGCKICSAFCHLPPFFPQKLRGSCLHYCMAGCFCKVKAWLPQCLCRVLPFGNAIAPLPGHI